MPDLLKWRTSAVIGGALLVSLVWVGLFFAGGDGVALLPFALPLVGGAAFVCLQGAYGRSWAIATVIVCATVLLTLDVRPPRATGDVGLDWQNGAKVLSWAIMLAICAPHYTRICRFLYDPVILFLVGFLFIAVLSSLVSTVPLITASSSVGIVAYLAIACLAADKIPQQRLLVILAWAIFAFILVNLSWFFIDPDLAYVQVDPENHPDITRFRGLSGNPNLLGRVASTFALLVFMVAYLKYMPCYQWLAMGVAGFFTMWLTESRTAVFSVIICYTMQLPRRILIPLLLIGGLLATLALLSGGSDTILAMIGRDGDAEEAGTMAGRTELWEFAWDLIKQRPLLGYGFNSFESYASIAWQGSPYAALTATHNNYLNVLFTTGVLGGIVFLGMFMILLYRLCFDRNVVRDLVVVNALAYGFSEADIPAIAIFPTLLFFIVLAIDAKRWLEARQ